MRAWAGAAALAMLAAPAMANDVAPGPGTDRTLKVGAAGGVSGLFDYAGDVDAYRVYLKKGVNYGFLAYTACRNKSVAIYDRNFKKLAQSTTTDPFHDAWAEHPAPYTGLYFVQVTNEPTPPDGGCSDDSLPTGAYFLTSRVNCGATRQTICRVALGTTGVRTIWASTDKAWSFFDVKTPGVYRFTALAYGDGAFGMVSSTIGLRAPNTAVIAERRVDYDGGEVVIQQNLAKAGRYFVVVRMPGILEDYGPQRYNIRIEKAE